MKSILLSVALVLLSITLLFAQVNKTTGLSLQQCVQTAVEKNINVQTARIDYEKSGYKVSETRSALLPKISVNGNFQDNLKLPTTLIPGEILGKPGTSLCIANGSPIQYKCFHQFKPGVIQPNCFNRIEAIEKISYHEHFRH